MAYLDQSELSQESTLILLRRLLKEAETLAVVDSTQRQRLTLDAITAGVTLPTVSTVSSVTNVAAQTGLAGMDREMYINQARIAAAGIRNRLFPATEAVSTPAASPDADLALESTLVLLRRIIKEADSLSVVDGQQRQRLTLDAITAGVALPTVSTVSSVTNVAAQTGMAGMDREMYINQARQAYAGIRSRLSYSTTGITNTGGANELVKSDGTNIVGAGLYQSVTRQFHAGTSNNWSLGYSDSPYLQRLHISLVGVLVGSELSVAEVRLHVTQNGTPSTVITPAKLSGMSNGGATSIGIGTGLQFETETQLGNREIGAQIDAVTTNITSTTEAFDLVFKTMSGGATAAQRLRVKSTGQMQLHNYTSSSSFTGTPVGYLQFDSSGNVITAAVPGGGSSGTTIQQGNGSGGFTAVDLLQGASAGDFTMGVAASTTGTVRKIVAAGTSATVIDIWIVPKVGSGVGQIFTTDPAANVAGATTLTQTGNIVQQSYSTGASVSPVFMLYRARGTYGSPVAINTGDSLGMVSFQGKAPTTGQGGGQIEVVVNGTTGSGIVPSDMIFSVSAPSTGTMTERFRIAANGLLSFSSNAGGGGTANFLRADGTWAAPAGTFGGSIANTQIAVGSGTNTIGGASTYTFSSGVVVQQGALAHIDMTSTTGTNQVYLRMDNTGGSMYIGQENSTGTWAGTGGAYNAIIYAATAISMMPGGVEKARFYTNGNLSLNGSLGVGIAANTAPSYVLDIRWGSGNNTVNIETAGSGQVDFRMSRTGGTAVTWDMYIPGGSSELRLWSTADKFSFDTSGNFIASANVTAYGTPSDKRLKNTIKPIIEGLSIVRLLKGVTYHWNKDTPQYNMVGIYSDAGFIAQDVMEVLPDMVRADNAGMLSIREKGLTPYIVKAVQEVDDEVTKLKKRVKELETKLGMV